MVSPLASLKMGVLRPKDAKGIYERPRRYFHRWEQEGVLLKLAHGYYVHIPEANRGETWRPEIEAIALGLGQADYGKNEVALMHISAARIHGAVPRALAVAVIAVPKQRPTIETTCGRIIFVKREVGRLKRVRTETELGSGWVTTIEQTALDLARRPNLIKGMSDDALVAAADLLSRANEAKLQAIVHEQRMGATYDRLRKLLRDA